MTKSAKKRLKNKLKKFQQEVEDRLIHDYEHRRIIIEPEIREGIIIIEREAPKADLIDKKEERKGGNVAQAPK